MIRSAVAALALGISALFATTAMAAGASKPQIGHPAIQRGGDSEAAAKSKVAQAQIEHYKKREQAKKRRDELLKVRAASIQTGGSGRR